MDVWKRVYSHLVVNMSIHEIWLKSVTNTGNELSDMAAKVATQNFEQRFSTLLLFNSTLYYSVELFLHLFNYSVIINRGIIYPAFAKVFRQYVIFGTDIFELEQMLDTLREFEMQNNGKFIIICHSEESNDCDEKELTKLLWDHRIVNVIVIKFEGTQAAGYTYFPISDGDCNNVTPIKVQSSKHSQFLTTDCGNIFGMKIKKYGSCPISVSTFIQPPYMTITNGTPNGADGDLLQILAYGLNASLTMMTPHRGFGWGFRLKNGTWSGSLADVYDGLANMSMTSAALTYSRFSEFHLSRSYYESHVVWITHPAALQNEALKLMRPFATSTQIALVVSYILVIVCALILSTYKSIYLKDECDEYSKSVVFYSWMICTGQALIKLPTKSFFLKIMILWVFYCFLIRTAYQVYLISSLKGTFYENQFESIDDAIKEKYPFGGGLALRDYYLDYPAVYDHWTNVDANEMLPTLLEMSKGKKFVVATNKDFVKMIMKKHKISLHILPRKIVSTPSVIFFKKYSPLAESVNLVLSRLVSSGLPEKFHQVYTTIKTVKVEDERVPLKIIHFTACYVVLVTGWILSFVFFIIEYYFGRLYKHPELSF